MGVAVPRAPVDTRSPKLPQKFGYGPWVVRQLLSRNQVSQNKQAAPLHRPPSKNFGIWQPNVFCHSIHIQLILSNILQRICS